MRIRKIMQALEEWAPPKLAEDWDNVGLLVGDPETEVTGILTALDVTKENIRYAKEHGINLIVAHHPILFKPLKQLVAGDPVADLMRLLVQNDIACYAAHTNLDIATAGVNDLLAEQIGLVDVKGLVPVHSEPFYKVAVFTPQTHADAVRAAMGDHGAGALGDYSNCTFSAQGQGRFLPLVGAQPFLGNPGQMETVEEERVEAIVPAHDLNTVLRAMLDAHPYEEAAYDVYPLERPRETSYLGRIGRFPKALSLVDALTQIRTALEIPVLRYAGQRRTIERVALCSGAGMEFADAAVQQGADLYLTADVKYHEVQRAAAQGIVVVDGHHYHTEIQIADRLAEYLTQALVTENVRLNIVADPVRADVFSFWGN